MKNTLNSKIMKTSVILSTIFGLTITLQSFAQQPINPIRLPYVVTEQGDTLPVVVLPYFTVVGERIFASRHEEKKWNRLKRDVTIVYPYAKTATRILRDCEKKCEGLSSSEQKKLYKSAEKQIIAEFEDDVRSMSLNQGRILIKLIDRNTGDSSFEIVKELRGSIQAFMWQTVARIFSTNLKEEYDPFNNKEDKMIESIIESIDSQSYVSL